MHILERIFHSMYDPRPGGDDIQRLVPANMRLSQTYSYNILSVGKLKLQPQDIVPIPKENMW